MRTLDPEAELDLVTERRRSAALVPSGSPGLPPIQRCGAATRRLLRAVWADGEPCMRELGRPTVERAVASARASHRAGQSPLEIVGEGHISRREKFVPLTASARCADGKLVLTPCYLAGGGHGHIVALPGHALRRDRDGRQQRHGAQRATAERIARDLKLLSDPTRVLILTELDRKPATVGEIAERVGVAQPTASVHVRQLREAGLLVATRDGASSSYRVERPRCARRCAAPRTRSCRRSLREADEPSHAVASEGRGLAPLRRCLRAQPRRPRGLLGRGGAAPSTGIGQPQRVLDRSRAPVLPLVPRRAS